MKDAADFFKETQSKGIEQKFQERADILNQVETIAKELTFALRLIYYSAIRTTLISEHEDMFDPDDSLQLNDHFAIDYLLISDELKSMDTALV